MCTKNNVINLPIPPSTLSWFKWDSIMKGVSVVFIKFLTKTVYPVSSPLGDVGEPQETSNVLASTAITFRFSTRPGTNQRNAYY